MPTAGLPDEESLLAAIRTLQQTPIKLGQEVTDAQNRACSAIIRALYTKLVRQARYYGLSAESAEEIVNRKLFHLLIEDLAHLGVPPGSGATPADLTVAPL